jgi:hypothetical protein
VAGTNVLNVVAFAQAGGVTVTATY